MRALGLARQRKERGHEAWALHLLGEIGFHEGMDLSSVQSHYRESLALAEQLGMRPLVAHCRIGLGKCYLRNGSTVTAHEHLTVATNSYREMNMQFWLNKGVAEARAP